MENWYHGSPLELTVLREGSTITKERDLARIFSHKPSLVTLDDRAGKILSIKHNGTLPGFLYCIAEEVGAEDAKPHPRSSMPPGFEWLTQRDLHLRLLEPTSPRPEEQLSESEIQELYERARQANL